MSSTVLASLDADTIRALVPMADAITALRSAFVSRPVHVPRTQVAIAGGDLLVMPAGLGDAAGVKIVMVQPANAASGRLIIQGHYVLFDALAGSPVAMLDGAALTALRTPAVSAIATASLASSEADTLIVIGGGPQALAHLAAISPTMPNLERRVLVTRTGLVSTPLDSDVELLGIDELAGLVGSLTNSVVCACTSAESPFLLGSDITAGSHVNLVGSYRPTRREADETLVSRAQVYVDDVTAARDEAGDLIIAAQHGWSWESVLGDLGDLAAERCRRDDESVTVFKSVGLAIEDLVIARLAYERSLM